MRQLTADQQRAKDLVAAFTTPLVCHPGGWEDTVPEWLKSRVIAERVAMLNDGGWDKATDAEVTCYLYTASLTQALSTSWTGITLYEAAKQIPQLRESVSLTPEELGPDQKYDLEKLKRDIRNSQLKRHTKRKEVQPMPERKLVLDEKGNSTMMGIMKEGADPHVMTIEGDLETALANVPRLLKEAEEKWAGSPKNPTYTAPKAEPAKPKEKPAATAAKPKEPEKSEDLPLLADKTEPAAEKPAEKPEEKPEEAAQPAAPGSEEQPQTPAEEAAPAPAETPSEVKAEETPSEAPAEPLVTEPVAGATEAEEAADQEAMKADIEARKPAPAPEPPPPATTPAPSGGYQYRLKDGRGPFDTVQAAMDELGLDKNTRPQHNRWDRLSTSLKDSIRREPKA